MTKIRVTLPSFKTIQTVTGLRRRYARSMIPVLKWLAKGAPKNNFPGVRQDVNFSMSSYIDITNHSVCIAGAIRLAHKGKYPKEDKRVHDMDRHFDLKDHTPMDTLFYTCPENYTATKAFWVLYGFAISGKIDMNLNNIDDDLKIEIT